MIDELIDAAVILENVTAVNKPEVLAEVVQAMVDAGHVPAAEVDGIRGQLDGREALGSTGIGNGVAVPHVKNEAQKTVSVAVARSVEGVEWEAIDGKPVHTVFLIVGPADAPEDHLAALRWISTLARNADFRRFVLQADSQQEIRDLLREMTG